MTISLAHWKNRAPFSQVCVLPTQQLGGRKICPGPQFPVSFFSTEAVTLLATTFYGLQLFLSWA